MTKKSEVKSFYEAIKYIEWAIPPIEFDISMLRPGAYMPSREKMLKEK